MRAQMFAVLSVLIATHAGPAASQGMGAHAPRAPQVRPLHERLELADAVAIGSIREVEMGRIQVGQATPLLGSPGDSFALKRAPSRPPALSHGDRALLLLRGARSPYVLVDTPIETITFADAESEARWRHAVGDLRMASRSPESLRDLYLTWLRESDAGLRDVAEIGLSSRQAPFAPLSQEVLERLVRDASDPSLESGRRRSSARVALAGPGAAALLERLPGDAQGADVRIVGDALRSAALRADLDVNPLLARALLHPREDVRASALRLSAMAARSPVARPALEQMAAEDPVEELRRKAQNALDRR